MEVLRVVLCVLAAAVIVRSDDDCATRIDAIYGASRKAEMFKLIYQNPPNFDDLCDTYSRAMEDLDLITHDTPKCADAANARTAAAKKDFSGICEESGEMATCTKTADNCEYNFTQALDQASTPECPCSLATALGDCLDSISAQCPSVIQTALQKAKTNVYQNKRLACCGASSIVLNSFLMGLLGIFYAVFRQ